MNRNISLASRDPLPLGREDIYKGMEEIGAYLDVTPRDFQEIYAHAYKIARGRLLSSITAGDIMHVPVLCVAEEQSVRDLVSSSTITAFPARPSWARKGAFPGSSRKATSSGSSAAGRR